jgi:hypothetical protein
MKLRNKFLSLALFSCFAFSVSRTKEISDYRPTEGQLVEAFNDLNRDYFYGGLPRTKVYIVDLADAIMGRCQKEPDGTYLILIDRKSHAVEKQAEMTEIHEMCHIEDGVRELPEGLDGHGPNFQACMERVASKHGFSKLW